MTSAIELARIYECEQTSRISEVSRALIASEARVARLEEALRPFANYACDEPCNCHNCIARAALRDGGSE
jgi:hypothetical protein